MENKEEVERMINQMDKSIEDFGLFTKVPKDPKISLKEKKQTKKPKGKLKNLPTDSKFESTVLININSPRKRRLNNRIPPRPICVNRITGLSDKKGKTRVVCIANIILQSFLKPVHDHLFHLLNIIETDGTHDQEAQAQRVRRATGLGKYCESIDMKSCTDRFPAVFQC